MPSIWDNPENVERVKTWHGMGMSNGEMAKKLERILNIPITRNMVVAKADRMRLANSVEAAQEAMRLSKKAPSVKPTGRTLAGLNNPKTRENMAAPVEKPIRARSEPALSRAPISIMELTLSTCRYPVDRPEGMFYCGTATHEDGVYCRRHHAFCYAGVPAKAPMKMPRTEGVW